VTGVVCVLDLFAGAGGLSAGLAAAGLEVAAAAERDADSLATFARLHPAVHLLRGDIAGLDLREFRGDIDVVAGGPPCQPWSDGGKRLGGADPRDGIPLFVEAIRTVGPRAFIMENVAGLARAATRSSFEYLVRRLRGLGYTVDWRVLRAADYGVPQSRQRLFVVGVLDGRVTWPTATHCPGTEQRWRTAGDVLDPARIVGEPNLSKVVYARRPDVRPSPYDGLLFNGGGRPINLDAVAPTMLASMGGNKTPWLDTLGIVPAYHAHLLSGGQPQSGSVPGARRITAAEAALLQTFPPGTAFAGTMSSQYRQIGNAVPPDLAHAVGLAVMRSFAAAEPTRSQAACPSQAMSSSQATDRSQASSAAPSVLSSAARDSGRSA
jgi:DNA (cytosine-5)-methyltransferase 1